MINVSFYVLFFLQNCISLWLIIYKTKPFFGFMTLYFPLVNLLAELPLEIFDFVFPCY